MSSVNFAAQFRHLGLMIDMEILAEIGQALLSTTVWRGVSLKFGAPESRAIARASGE